MNTLPNNLSSHRILLYIYKLNTLSNVLVLSIVQYRLPLIEAKKPCEHGGYFYICANPALKNEVVYG